MEEFVHNILPLIGLIVTIGNCGATLWTRATVADLKLELRDREERREEKMQDWVKDEIAAAAKKGGPE